MTIRRLFDIPYYQLENYPKPDMFSVKENGKWRSYSTQESIDIIRKVSLALIESGINKDDKIGIVSNNRPEWNFIDLGILQSGAINVPVYPTITSEDYKYIFNDAEVRICFVSDKDLYDKVNAIKSEVNSLMEIYTFEKVEGAKHWTEFLQKADEKHADELKHRMDIIKKEELATIIYTSGTTGVPKGVMLSHHNIIENLLSVIPCLPVRSHHRTLSFLPLCHSFERTVLYYYIYTGASIYYAESMETIGENLKEIKPHFFSSVPRLLEKVYDKIMDKGRELTGIKKVLFFWAIALGHEYEFRGKSAWYKLKLSIANKIIFSKWREALGGEVIGIVTGASALQPRLARVFNAAQIKVREGYGLTETSPVLTFNRFDDDDAEFGTVGVAIPKVEIKIAADGEILAKGPNIMMGYYKKEKETAEVLDKDGWFSTGDIGEWVDNKFLKITDRKKELYKTSGGKYVAPQPIENKFKESALIEQIMVIGDNQRFVTALIVPALPALTSLCKAKGISVDNTESLLNEKAVLEMYTQILAEYNPSFSNTDQIKKFKLMPAEWTIAGGELTPTMKVKRKFILNKYASEIEAIYAE